MNQWKPILAALVIFAAGVVTGALTLGGNRASPAVYKGPRVEDRRGPRPDRSKEGHLRDLCGRLQNELNLTPAQREKIEEIVRLTHERVKLLADKMFPPIRAEFTQMEQDILKELTPDQAVKFQAIIREREAKFNRGDTPPPPASIDPRNDEAEPPDLGRP